MNETQSSTAAPETASTSIVRPLSAAELGSILGVHPVTLLRWSREGRIPCCRLSARKVLFIPSDVNKWLASNSSLYSEQATRAAITERMAA
jgi:excisionase family DNA binding protein